MSSRIPGFLQFETKKLEIKHLLKYFFNVIFSTDESGSWLCFLLLELRQSRVGVTSESRRSLVRVVSDSRYHNIF